MALIRERTQPMTNKEEIIKRVKKLKALGIFTEFANAYIAFTPETPEQMQAILDAEKALGMTGKDSDIHGQRYWLFQREPESIT
jgi:hypothetical protein